MLKGKKGDITDMLALLVTVFVLAVGLFIMAWIIPSITSGLRTANLNNSVEGTSAINTLNDFGINGIQRGFFWLFIGLCISVLISSFYIDTHPVWLFLYIIFLGITVLIGTYLGNTYQSMLSISAFDGFQQGYITLVMSHIVQIMIGVGAVSFIIIFGKFAFFGGSGGRM